MEDDFSEWTPFFYNHWKKWKIGLKIGYGNLGSFLFGGWILRFYPVFCQIHWKKWKFGVKIAYGNFGYYSLLAWMLRIDPVFLEFTDQMENRGKDGIWELSVSLSLKIMENRVKITNHKLGYVSLVGWIVWFYPIFTEFLEKCKEPGQRLNMTS